MKILKRNTALLTVLLLTMIYITSCNANTIIDNTTEQETENKGNTEEEQEEPDLLDPVPAKSAFDFYHSIGVCTHLGYANTAYNDFEGIVYPRLMELGVRHIRDGYSARMSQDEQDERYEKLGKAGIKLLFNAGNFSADEIMPRIKKISPWLSGVEGANEVDFSNGRNPDIWVPVSIERQKTLYAAMKNDPVTKDIPVVNFSLAELHKAAVLVGDQTENMDYGNMHIYAAGRNPANHWGNGLTQEQALEYARIVSVNKPIIMTECGYHNHVLYPQGHPGVPEEVSAIYSLHLLFQYFNQGIVRSYFYELLNEDIIGTGENKPIEKNFGMVKSDGTPKPAFIALKNLITLIKDNTPVEAQPLGFVLNAEDENVSSKMKYTLLQKSDKSWWLAVYLTDNIFDWKTLETSMPEAQRIGLSLGKKVKEINLYMPNRSTGKINSFENVTEFEFELGAELILLEIKR